MVQLLSFACGYPVFLTPFIEETICIGTFSISFLATDIFQASRTVPGTLVMFNKYLLNE